MSGPTPYLEGLSTRPEQIDPNALIELKLELLYGERIALCWRTGFGFLVMTNLRCIHVWRKPELFVRTEWHAGPSFFFYNLTPPRVVAGRFLELTEEHDRITESARFLLHDPKAVGHEINEARPGGRAEWEARRIRA